MSDIAQVIVEAIEQQNAHDRGDFCVETSLIFLMKQRGMTELEVSREWVESLDSSSEVCHIHTLLLEDRTKVQLVPGYDCQSGAEKLQN